MIVFDASFNTAGEDDVEVLVAITDDVPPIKPEFKLSGKRGMPTVVRLCVVFVPEEASDVNGSDNEDNAAVQTMIDDWVLDSVHVVAEDATVTFTPVLPLLVEAADVVDPADTGTAEVSG